MSAIASATATADRAIRSFQGMGPTASAAPTPQRLLKAGGLAQIEIAVDSQGSAAMKTPRIRVTATPLEVMAQRRRLDANPILAQAMLSAGRRYLVLWTKAGLSPIRGQDPGAIRTTAVGAGFLGTEAKCEAFAEYRMASDDMQPEARRAVDAIVLHEMAMVDAGAKVDPMTTDRASRIALATYELRKGLRVLALHFGLISAEALGPITDAAPIAMPDEMADLLAAMDAREARGA